MRVRRGRFRRTFITGVLFILPLFVTVWVIRLIFRSIDKAVTPIVLRTIRLLGFGWVLEKGWVDYIAPFISITLLILIIYVLGLIGGNVVGRQMLAGLDRLMRTIPFVRGIYTSTRQFLDTFSGSRRAFSKVVLVEYPRQGLWTMALLTSEVRGEIAEQVGQDLVSVFVPTTPNPTSGWLLFVPKGDIIELAMSVDEAFKMIISGGVLVPPGTNVGAR